MSGISIKQYIKMMHFCFGYLALGLWCGGGLHTVTERKNERRGMAEQKKEDENQASRRGNSEKKREREKERGESMAERLIDAVYGVIIGHCVSLAWDSRKCDR